MEITFKDRLLIFLNYLKIGQTKFESYTGLVRGSISKIKDGMSAPNLAKIAKNYPQLSIDWLITGQGEMLKQDTKAKEGINLNNIGSGIIGNAGTMTMGNVQHYPNNVDGNNLVVDDGIKDDKDQQIILLKEKVLHLEEMLKEKERFIQVLLKNSNS